LEKLNILVSKSVIYLARISIILTLFYPHQAPAQATNNNFSLVQINDWGFGFVATFEYEIQSEDLTNAQLADWVIDVNYGGTAIFATAWMTGYNGPISYGYTNGVFQITNVGQNYQPPMMLGEVLTFSVLASGSAFNLADFELQIDTFQDPVSQDDLILGKSATVSGNELTIELVARNAGTQPLYNLAISDDLDNTFGAGNYSLVGVPQLISGPAGYTIDPSYTGETTTANLILGSAALTADQSVHVSFVVQVNDANAATVESYFNQAIAQAASDVTGGVTIADLSGDGLDTSQDNDSQTEILIEQPPELPINYSGYVFSDTAPDVAISHDGIFNAIEVGVSDRTIQIVDTETAAIVATAVTNLSGQWYAALDASQAEKVHEITLLSNPYSQIISESPNYTNGLVSDGKLLVAAPIQGGSITNINFGIIPFPEFQRDQSKYAFPNSSAKYTHTYVAPSHGEMSLLAQGSNSWSTRIVLDENCNLSADSGEGLFVSPYTVVPGQKVCFIADIFVPANVLANANQILDLNVSYTASDVSGIGHNVVLDSSNSDITTALPSLAGKIDLLKSVKNIDTNTSFGTSNIASPDDQIEYLITYTNTGNAAVVNWTIYDRLPPHTHILTGSALCGVVPVAVSCEPFESGDQLRWELNGNLNPGESGSVRFIVQVD